MTVAGRKVAESGSGAFDYRRRVGRLAMTMDGLGGMQEILTPDAIYLRMPDSVSGVLASRNEQITKLIQDADVVLQLVEDQRAVIHDLLVNTADLASQLTALVNENRAALSPALDDLHSVLNILEKHRDDLDTAIHELAPFVRNFDNTLGNGHFFDNFIADLPPGAFPAVQGGAGSGGGG